MDSDNRLQHVKLLEGICRASHGELLTAVLKLLAQCMREDLSLNNVPNGGTLHTIEIYNLLNSVLGDTKERDTK
jgi:hypothetical protein